MRKKEVAEAAQKLEILKAVAQAWLGRSGNTRPMKEFDAQRRNTCRCTRPSRFKLEAIINKKKQQQVLASPSWDFAQSLWDSYEIVSLSKRLESGLVMDQLYPLDLGGPVQGPVRRIKRRESKNSLRSLFKRISSTRYDPDHIKPPR